MRRALVILLASLGLVAVWPLPGMAHKVSVHAYVEAGKIMGQGYFADGGKVKGVPVTLSDAAGAKLAATVTGGDGTFELPLVAATPPLTVTLMASEGHRAVMELTAADLGGAVAATVPAGDKQVAKAQTAEVPALPSGDMDKRIAAAVDEAVARRLAPVQAQLTRMAEQADKVGMRDVVGGLGWILGLCGIAAYFAARKGRPHGG